MAAIKSHLKGYYIQLYNPNGKISEEKKLKLLNKNLYSREKNEKRTLDYEEVREKHIIGSNDTEKAPKQVLHFICHA